MNYTNIFEDLWVKPFNVKKNKIVLKFIRKTDNNELYEYTKTYHLKNSEWVADLKRTWMPTIITNPVMIDYLNKLNRGA